MIKPIPKTEVKIDWASRSLYMIRFFASNDAAVEFAEFGSLSLGFAGGFTLFVDARYNFDEVVAYIEGYGQDDDEQS